MPKLDTIILAAGRGKRIHQASLGVPKVLLPVAEKPMLLRLLDAVERARLNGRTVVVVGPSVEAVVRKALANRDVIVALQSDPKGTGHAVGCAQKHLPGAEHLLVLYGDQPLYSAKTIKAIADQHKKSGAIVTMLTVKLPNFRGWRASFSDWARIIRNGENRFARSVEAKDARAEELKITEVNPSLYCFEADWLWKHLEKLTPHNTQKELYLPDVLKMAVDEGAKIETVPVADPRETIGVNTPEQLAVVEDIFQKVKELWEKDEPALRQGGRAP